MNLTSQKVYQKGEKRKRIRNNDKLFLEWLRTQRSAYSNRIPCEACHFRTASNAGVGIKSLFSALPLTSPEHREQHRIGQFAFASRIWWEYQVKRHQTLYIMQGGVIPEKYRL